MKHIVVLTGAGVSADSGVKTFRDHNGLWEGHDVTEVATPQGFARNPALVLDFYNQRRAQLKKVKPNAGHHALKDLESHYKVSIITQNVDDLHERAGSSNVIHLHGELLKARSVKNENLIVDWPDDISLGTLAPDGEQLRPHIVWFGEGVPMISEAARVVTTADILLIVGTSLLVYPANSLIEYATYSIPIYVVDPVKPEIYTHHEIDFIQARSAEGLPRLAQKLIEEAQHHG